MHVVWTLSILYYTQAISDLPPISFYIGHHSVFCKQIFLQGVWQLPVFCSIDLKFVKISGPACALVQYIAYI